MEEGIPSQDQRQETRARRLQGPQQGLDRSVGKANREASEPEASPNGSKTVLGGGVKHGHRYQGGFCRIYGLVDGTPTAKKAWRKQQKSQPMHRVR